MSQRREIEFVRLYDVSNQKYVDAELRNFISEDSVEDWRSKWVPEMFRLVGRIFDRGGEIREHIDSPKWNWSAKVSDMRLTDSQMGCSLVSQGETQAMMIVDINKKCKLPQQQNGDLVYIEYIQTAPWNNRRLNDNFVRFAGCGSILFHKAIRLSRAMSMGGRIGLHSLQSSIGSTKEQERAIWVLILIILDLHTSK